MQKQKFYFTKFFIIVLSLLISGFILLGSFFYQDTLDAIKLSHQQELGISYLSTLNGILQNVTLHQHKNSHFLESEIDTQFEKLKQMHRKYAHQFYIADTDLERQNKDDLKFTSLLSSWGRIRSQSEDRFLHLNLIHQLRELTEIVSEQSRVASDFDPRISYLSDIIWLKAPENLEILSKLVHAEYVRDQAVLIAYLRSNLEGFRETVGKLRFHSHPEEHPGLHYYIETPIENMFTHETAFLEAIHYSPPETIAAALFKSLNANAQFVAEASNYLAILKLAKAEQTNFHSSLLLGTGIVLLIISLILTIIYSIQEKRHKIVKRV